MGITPAYNTPDLAFRAIQAASLLESRRPGLSQSPTPLILVVDDDTSIRAALVSLIRSMGFNARAFASAGDLLASGVAEVGACIISDIQMPGMNGVELEARLRADGVRTPIIMVTARTEPDLLKAAQASSAICVLRKPFDAAALEACLERALT